MRSQLYPRLRQLFLPKKRSITTVSSFPLQEHATNQYIKALEGSSPPPRGPFPGFHAKMTDHPHPSVLTPAHTPKQQNLKTILPQHTTMTIEDDQGIFSPPLGGKPSDMQHDVSTSITGPACVDISINPNTPSSRISFSGTGKAFTRLYESEPEAPIKIGASHKKWDNKKLGSHRIKMGVEAIGDPKIGPHVADLAATVSENYKRFAVDANDVGAHPDSPVQDFDACRTFRNLSLTKDNTTAHYLMYYGFARHPNDYDNPMHEHPKKRVEQHLLGSGTFGVVMSLNPIEQANGHPLSNIKVNDPYRPNTTLYIHIIPPNSLDSLYLPQCTPHKFKPSLHPTLYRFCCDIEPILIHKGYIDKDVFEPSYRITEILKDNPEILETIPELQDTFLKYGGEEHIRYLAEGAGLYMINTLHTEEREEIEIEGIVEGVRSSEAGSSIIGQTGFLEPPHTYITEKTMQELIGPFFDRNTLSEKEKNVFETHMREDFHRTQAPDTCFQDRVLEDRDHLGKSR